MYLFYEDYIHYKTIDTYNADAGHYTCSATNAVGQRNSSSTVELKVNQGMLIMFAKSIQACLIDKSIRLSRQVPLVDQELLRH
jgi:hypothetical protein